MKLQILRYFFFLIIVTFAQSQPLRQNLYTTIVPLQFISPDELIDNLLLQKQLGDDYILKTEEGTVKFLVNKSTNQILLTGDSISVLQAKNMIEFLDVAPRQIVIEAKIVEFNNKRMADLGIDLQRFLDNMNFQMGTNINVENMKREYNGGQYNEKYTRFSFSGGAGVYSMSIGDLIKIIQEQGIGKIISTPKITTINNKTGILLDGSRITYVARYSSYANIYETSELSAGLYLEVTPSLGDNDYLRLDVIAKLTTLGEVIGGSPSELGQQVKNTVIVKNGQEFLLGSFKKMEKIKTKRKVPILGTLLPFLFSRISEAEIYRDFLVILKPQVIDLNPPELPKIEEK